MADEKNDKKTKKSAVDLFREKIMKKEEVQATILEGIKSTNARVRALAIKLAFKTQEHPFVKKNVLPLIAGDKSKKVLRTLAEKVTRKELKKKLKSLWAAK